MPRITAAAIASLASLTSIAHAGSIVLNIDSAQSSINVDATLDTPVGVDSDSGSSSVSGTIEVDLDNDGNPTAITLVDFILVLDNNISLNFSYGFLGNANVTLANAMAMYANPGTPLGPVAITADAFDFPAVPATLAGNADYSYSFFLVGSGSDSLVLSDFPPFDSPIGGTITSDGTTVTLAGTLDFDVTEPLLDGTASVNLVGSATIVATGNVPAPAGCNAADIAEPFNVLDLADIGTFVSAFTSQDPAADIAPPAGVFDLADLGAFIAAFTAGCP